MQNWLGAEALRVVLGDRWAKRLLTVYLLVEDDVVTDVAFQGTACAIAMASASLMTERVKGQTVGFLNLESATPGFFTAGHAARLQAFADQAALAVDSVCEMWGSMVYEGVIPHRMLDRMVGGWVRGTWRRLRRWAEAERVEHNPNAAEWWQWLFEVLEEDPDPGKARGAHISYRGRGRVR